MKKAKTKAPTKARKTVRRPARAASAPRREPRATNENRPPAPEPVLATPLPPPALVIPSILFEGDEALPSWAPAPETPPATSESAAVPAPPPPDPSPAPLAGGEPESAPAARPEPSLLELTPREPRSLYAHWSLGAADAARVAARSVDGRTVLRIARSPAGASALVELLPPAAAGHEFIEVPAGGTCYAGELGYYERAGGWSVLTTSEAVTTPVETPCEDETVVFATLQPLDEEPVALVPAPETALAEPTPTPEPALVAETPAPPAEPPAAEEAAVAPVPEPVNLASTDAPPAPVEGEAPPAPALPEPEVPEVATAAALPAGTAAPAPAIFPVHARALGWTPPPPVPLAGARWTPRHRRVLAVLTGYTPSRPGGSSLDLVE